MPGLLGRYKDRPLPIPSAQKTRWFFMFCSPNPPSKPHVCNFSLWFEPKNQITYESKWEYPPSCCFFLATKNQIGIWNHPIFAGPSPYFPDLQTTSVHRIILCGQGIQSFLFKAACLQPLGLFLQEKGVNKNLLEIGAIFQQNLELILYLHFWLNHPCEKHYIVKLDQGWSG